MKNTATNMKLSTILTLTLALAGSAYAEPATLTAYCPCTQCCGDFAGKIRGQTASGTMAQAGRTIAAPKGVPFGLRVLALMPDGSQHVIGTVEDRGGAIKGNKLDLYFDSHAEALRFGVQQAEITFTEGAE